MTRDGHAVPFALDGRAVVVHEEPASGRDGTNGKNENDDADEELRYVIGVNGRDSVAVFRRLPALTTLAERRCRFIAGKQQCGDEGSHLYGSYLAYDNDTRRQYYGHWNDHNGGRERVGMGALMALELQHRPDKALEESLDRYLDYVLRELFDDETGEVFNDAPRDGSFKRLYNYPWVGVLFLETYHLKHDAEYLRRYVRCMRRYYAEGGDRFYSIGLPMIDSVNALREAGMNDEADEMLADYRRHGDRIASFGRDYPEHEVNYEQSIVGPAAVYMCELYHLTGEAHYRDEAIRQLEILSLFNGHQPHYRMHEVALRHWDDYWFGKRQVFGDTFPHYWSSITGVAFAEAEGIDAGYVARAADSLRGSLTLIHGDGSDTCAHVFPSEVNGRSAAFDDLRVYPTADGGEPDWAGMHISTSTRIDVWESHDLVHWSDMRQLDVSVGAEDKRFGIAWAPEAIWVDDYEGTGHGRFVFYWAATFGASGPDVTAYDRATMYPRMVWGTTTDFTQGTYEFGGVMLDTGAETIDTTIFREHRDDGTTRTYRLTKQNGRGAGNGIFEDYTDRPDWWKVPQDEWTYIDTHIGDGFAHELGNPDPGCAEGPETFPDNHSGRRYLFVDVLGVADTGYRPMYSDDTDDHVSYGDGQNAGWRKLDDPDYEMPPLVKHGGFINLTRDEYDELRRAY